MKIPLDKDKIGVILFLEMMSYFRGIKMKTTEMICGVETEVERFEDFKVWLTGNTVTVLLVDPDDGFYVSGHRKPYPTKEEAEVAMAKEIELLKLSYL